MPELPTSLHDLGFLDSVKSRVDLVLIPGIATPAVEQWGLCREPWLEILGALRTHTRLLAYSCDISLDSDFDWQRLLDEGARLLSTLVELCYHDDSDVSSRPIILVCHSLGGLVVKQALSIANLRAIQHHKYRHFINCIAGIVFISTPHNHGLLQDRATTIVKHFAGDKLSKQHLTHLKADATKLVDIIGRFQNVNLGLDILTLYERLPTKSKRGWRSRSVLIVDRELAEIKASHEVCSALNADHATICDLRQTDGRPDGEVCRWLTTVIDNAVHNIEERLKASDAVRNPPSTGTSIHTETSIVGLNKSAAALEIDPDDVHWASAKAQDGSSSSFDRNMNTIFENFSTARSEANLPCFVVNTITQNEDFYGRDNVLAELDKALLPRTDLIASSEPGKMNHVILCGMAGMGKTEIAVQFVHTRRQHYDAIFWIRAEDSDKLVADFSQIAQELGLIDPNEPENPVVCRDVAKGWLTNPKRLLGERDDAAGQESPSWLLVFDNADNPDLLQDYIPIFGRGSILITTREPNGKNFHASDPVVIHLDPFNDDDSTAFLSHLTRAHKQQRQRDEIATLLGGLPLALAQMAGVMKKQYLDYSEFLEMYEDITERADIHEMDIGMPRQTARGTVSSIWAIGTLSPPTRNLLEIFSFLDPDRIQDYVVVNKNVENIDCDLSMIPTSRAKFLRARGELLHQSLIRLNEQKKEIWMHRVLQDVVKAQLAKKSSDNLVTAFRQAVALVHAAWPVPPAEKRHSVERWPTCEALYPHVAQLEEFFENHLQTAGADPKLQLELVTLLHEAAWWQYERGSFASARLMGEKAGKLCMELDTASNMHTISRNHDLLGCVANGTNNPASSMEQNTKLLELRMKIRTETGKEDVLLAYAHNQFGCSLMMAGRYEEATEYFKEALEIWRRLPEFKPGLPSMEYSNLGLALWMQDKLDEASAVLEQGQREREEGFGPGDTESFRAGRILYALGNVRYSQGQVQESENFHQRALLQFQSTIGNSYHRTADICHKLAEHCLRRGTGSSLEKAHKLTNQALATWQADNIGFRNEIARTTYLKSKIMEQLGEAEEANTLRADAIERWRKLRPNSSLSGAELTEREFDDLVTFWSR
ncbi:hypothetical protein BCR34DRAFT_523570 [Clohesyomyces aquaticus]|uniref:Uncharacterized protein n=1 Tax=Clohesyomyces aquaticus TaxID=1231657 RepID=A0A1Y1YLF8_9PLEO|nr:hypothetical protein BCR34DRAFT_523570 [Clohesyomyces aquaticus]